MKKLLILSSRESDLSRVLRTVSDCTLLNYEQALSADLSVYEAFAVLGGVNDQETCLDARVRCRLEEENAGGKRVFLEYVTSFAWTYSAAPVQTSHKRLMCCADGAHAIEGMSVGDLLDDHHNDYIAPYCKMPDSTPLLVYHNYPCAHSHISCTLEEAANGDWALWQAGEHLLFCAFRLCDFNRARLAPARIWRSVIIQIIQWLTGTGDIICDWPEPIVKHRQFYDTNNDAEFNKALSECVEKGLQWLSEFLVDDGRGGILEGLSHNIRPDGQQQYNCTVRTDCCGEAAGAFRFRYLADGDKNAYEIAKHLDDFCFGPMQIHNGIFDGMLRWTAAAWGVCYQDDAARSVIPVFLSNLFGMVNPHLEAAISAMRYCLSTTARDGLRIWRTDNINMNENSITALQIAEHGTPSAHYNAYYCCALILAKLCGGGVEFLEAGRRGLENLMALYPETVREQSETEEMCRLILPLAVLYWATGDEKHRLMLYRVTEDLQRFRDSSGAYMEWDSGYKATCARKEHGECSLLAENGDPVVDLLYSCNWLPAGFAFAYKATGDEWFYQLWRSVVIFLICSQIHSPDQKLDGAWCRGFDVREWEVYGVPHDIGWGPCSVESGWTVGEILTGIQMMKLIKCHQSNIL
jgi:hypothetical protein